MTDMTLNVVELVVIESVCNGRAGERARTRGRPRREIGHDASLRHGAS